MVTVLLAFDHFDFGKENFPAAAHVPALSLQIKYV